MASRIHGNQAALTTQPMCRAFPTITPENLEHTPSAMEPPQGTPVRWSKRYAPVPANHTWKRYSACMEAMLYRPGKEKSQLTGYQVPGSPCWGNPPVM
jgi:hypothetical protein